MAIIHYPGYITKEQATKHYKVKLNTISTWIRNRKSALDKQFSFVIVDGIVGIKDHSVTTPPPNIILSELLLAEKVARRNKMRGHTIYEQIIAGNVTGVMLVGRVFVIKSEPALLALLNIKRRK